MNSAIVGWNTLYISAIYNQSMMFKSSISLLVFCLVLSIIRSVESEMLKSPTVTVELAISFFNTISVCFIYSEVLMFGAYMIITVVSSWWLDLFLLCNVSPYFCNNFWHKSVLSNISIATHALFWLLFVLNFFLSFHFQPKHVLNLKWVL